MQFNEINSINIKLFKYIYIYIICTEVSLSFAVAAQRSLFVTSRASSALSCQILMRKLLKKSIGFLKKLFFLNKNIAKNYSG